jgi:ketosteroid isomerase-like protein
MYEAFARRDLRQLGQLLIPAVAFTLGDAGHVWEEGCEVLLDRLAALVNLSGGTAAAVLLGIYSGGDHRIIAVHRELASWPGGRHEALGCLLITVGSGGIQALERFCVTVPVSPFRETMDAPTGGGPDNGQDGPNDEGTINEPSTGRGILSWRRIAASSAGSRSPDGRGGAGVRRHEFAYARCSVGVHPPEC